jgi:hypothetical protein
MSWYILTGLVLLAFALISLIVVKYAQYRQKHTR